jgi:hypothetical protein
MNISKLHVDPSISERFKGDRPPTVIRLLHQGVRKQPVKIGIRHLVVFESMAAAKLFGPPRLLALRHALFRFASLKARSQSSQAHGQVAHKNFSTPDTIYALSSAPGKAGVAVIRVSGNHAHAALQLMIKGLEYRETA